ncbi:hypothetical protein BMS3Abin07_00501 [bacterium BMS3Abin07]|nr:hypothetical protein BMS3Abin07_00501 [bacterium BMS3Abin07]GBE00606.1 hypothetical protein BMS3Abin08_00022 [bacterium BMS3Abin08]GBE33015.1 hypothetical protein BMS3Bbin05_01947 [bacterium BMS3Bbin05]HDL21124.1 hypothetical protein [Nitrospirota bacterium]HDO22112.1 hypothetical protein [Nitrospirota bacterium]
MVKERKHILWIIILLAGIALYGGEVIPLNVSLDGYTKTDIATAADAAEVPFSRFIWYPSRSGIKRAQISYSVAKTLRFDFIINKKTDISEVKFGIPRSYAKMGIRIEPNKVAVSNGRAGSKAVFEIQPGIPIGRFDMLVVAVNAKTGKVIGKGKIPFILVPAGGD